MSGQADNPKREEQVTLTSTEKTRNKASNEVTKIIATLFNNVAVACFVYALVIPFANLSILLVAVQSAVLCIMGAASHVFARRFIMKYYVSEG